MGLCQMPVILLRLLRSQLRLCLEMATLGIVETSFPSALAETPYSPILEEELPTRRFPQKIRKEIKLSTPKGEGSMKNAFVYSLADICEYE